METKDLVLSWISARCRNAATPTHEWRK